MGYMSEEIMYPSHIGWRVALDGVNDVAHFFGTETVKRVEKSKTLLAQSPTGFRFICEPVTPAWLDAFVPLYEEYIGAKEHAAVSQVRAHIAAEQAKGKAYETISLWEGKKFLGGVIYAVMKDRIQVAYRVFPRQLSVKLPVGVSYLAEDYLYRRVFELGKKTIVHGRDRNPYGLNSAIGLAEYKLKIGCAPFVSSAPVVTFKKLAELPAHQEALVFLGTEKERTITQARLISERALEEQQRVYGILFKQTTVAIEVVNPSASGRG